MHSKAKILIVGPPQVGKTVLTNFLSQVGEIGSGDYRPTVGCRIVEFEVPNVSVNNTTTRAEIELYDVSGDRKYEMCWPAIQRGSNGVIFVYNPDNENHPHALDSLYSHFVEQQGLRPAQCIVFCHYKPGAKGKGADLSHYFQKIPQIDTQLEEGENQLRNDFANFISSVMSHMSDVAERQENFILQ